MRRLVVRSSLDELGVKESEKRLCEVDLLQAFKYHSSLLAILIAFHQQALYVALQLVEHELESVALWAHDNYVLCLVRHEAPTFFAADFFIAHDCNELVLDPGSHA